MSDEEDDDRMDRARRIRRMREGDDERPADDETVADDADEPTDQTAAETAEADAGDADEQDAVDDESEMEWGSPGGEADHEPAGDSLEDQDEAVPDGDDDGINAPLPGSEQLEAALEESDEDTAAETVAPDEVGGDESEEESEEETRVLEFTLHDEHYCLDIDFIEEIVKEETVTRVPNTPAFVEGVVDLRGQITTILNPKVTIGKADQTAGDLIVVFDSEAFEDQGHIGWVVDDVRQVSLINDGDVNDPPIDQDHVVGVIDREDDDEFVIWTTPDLVFDEAENAAAEQ
jgi:purine-binding chemotaxis protein CheW